MFFEFLEVWLGVWTGFFLLRIYFVFRVFLGIVGFDGGGAGRLVCRGLVFVRFLARGVGRVVIG